MANSNEETLSRLNGLRILVVDDNETNRFILREMMRASGAVIKEAEGGKEALEAMRSLKPGEVFDLILLDCRMPYMDGFEFARQVRKDSRFSSATIMMLTSDGRSEHSGQVKELGLAAYLVKPIKKNELMQAIATVLKGKQNAAPAGAQAAVVASDTDPNARRILLVEDNPDNRRVVELFLKKTHYVLDMAENGQIAIEKLQRGSRYDLVLMDLHMPVLDGYATTRLIRKSEEGKAGKRLPVLALSASALQSHIHKSLEAGCDEHLCKPIKKEALLKALERHLGNGDAAMRKAA